MTESLYLAGKMAGVENFNHDHFNKVAAKLRELEYEVINPAAFYDPKDFDWYECLRRDIRFLAACDSICLLPGWQDSHGACLEYRTARDLGLKIYYWDEDKQLPVAPFIIGICGYARSGKDTFGDVLSDEHGFCSVAYADSVKTTAFASLPDSLQQEIINLDEGGRLFEGAKQEPKWRQYLQRFGTEGIRALDPYFWIRNVLDNLPSYRVCITDIRFENEMQEIRKRGGVIVWINRPGVGPVNSHSSDNSINSGMCDTIIDNDKGIQNLSHAAYLLLEEQGVL